MPARAKGSAIDRRRMELPNITAVVGKVKGTWPHAVLGPKLAAWKSSINDVSRRGWGGCCRTTPRNHLQKYKDTFWYCTSQAMLIPHTAGRVGGICPHGGRAGIYIDYSCHWLTLSLHVLQLDWTVIFFMHFSHICSTLWQKVYRHHAKSMAGVKTAVKVPQHADHTFWKSQCMSRSVLSPHSLYLCLVKHRSYRILNSTLPALVAVCFV